MKTVVFGIGDCWGKYLSTFSDMSVDFFCESNPQKDSFCGYPLIGIDALKKIDDNYQVIIAVEDPYKYHEISVELTARKIKHEWLLGKGTPTACIHIIKHTGGRYSIV